MLSTIAVAGMNLYSHNPERKSISFGNEGLTFLYLSKTRLAGLSIDNAEYRLAPGDTMDLSFWIDGEEIRQPWSVISSAAGGLLRHSESSER